MSRADCIAFNSIVEVYLLSEEYSIFLVLPQAITAFARVLKLVLRSGYIVVTVSDTFTISIEFMFSLSTVTWISTGLPFKEIEAVYTPGLYVWEVLSDDKFVTFLPDVFTAGLLLSEVFDFNMKKIMAIIRMTAIIAPVIRALELITIIFVLEFICTHLNFCYYKCM